MPDNYNHTLKALIREITNPKQEMVHVLFDSGYENVFYRDVESGLWIEQDLGATELAKRVGRARGPGFSFPTPSLRLKWIHFTIGRQSIGFGFFKYPIADGLAFDIYSVNKRFMLTVSKVNEEAWYAIHYGGEADWNFNADIIEELPILLEGFLDDIY